MKSVDKNCPPIKFVGLLGVSCLGHKRPKMLKNLEWQTFRVDTALGQCGNLFGAKFLRHKEMKKRKESLEIEN